MKKIGILLAILAFSGCKDVLEEQPKSLAVQNFYNTPAELEAAVAAIYAPLRNGNCLGGLYPAQHEAMPDYGNGRGSYTIISDYVGLDNTNITRVGQMWDLFYQAIRNANLVIENAPNATATTLEEAMPFIAEARFMRAFAYFIMVRNWGGVPLRTEANATEPTLARNTIEEVYQLVVDDLLFAEQNLPETAKQNGRPSQLVAKTVLADVYLHREQWAEARDKAAEVMQAGKYSLVPVTDSEDFISVFGADVVTTPEEIFYLKYSRQSSQGWFFVMFAHHPGARYHGAGGYFAHYTDSVTNPFIANWNPADLRKTYNLYPYNIGLGNTSVLNRKFRDVAATNANAAANDYPIYRYADLLLLHAEAASRVNGAPTPEAMESLNQVHRRAYGYPLNAPSPVDFNAGDYTGESFLALVIQERGYETMYEGKRWLDLKRLGIAKDVIKATKGKDVADKHLLWPIPVSELNYNEAINPTTDQNPGY